MRVVVDANIAFRALARGCGGLRSQMDSTANDGFFAPFFVLIELYKHKERIQRLLKTMCSRRCMSFVNA